MKSKLCSKVGSVVLSGALLAGAMLPSLPCAFAASRDGTITMTQLVNGTASAVSGDTVSISSDAELDQFVTFVNETGSDGKPVHDTSGITFQLQELAEDAAPYTVDQVIAPASFGSADTNSPYVVSGKGFEGTFDGNSQSIDVTLKYSDVESDSAIANGFALFGYLAPDGTVENLTVTGEVDVTCASDNANGVSAVAGVVAYNSGIINNVTNKATVTGGSSVYNVGGVAGFNDNYYMSDALGIIINSKNASAVTGYEKVGGITGENAGTVASCFNNATIHGTSTRKIGVGGIAGRNGNNDTAVETAVISTCLNIGAVSAGTGTGEEAGSWGGGIAGFQNSKSITNYSWSTETATGWGSVGTIVGSDDNTSADAELGCTEKTLVNSNGTYTAAYGAWANTSSFTEASLNYKASAAELLKEVEGGNAYVTPADGWQTEETKVYLDGTATTNGNGKEDSPYNNLTDAVNAANGGTVVVTGTVSLPDGSYYDSVTFERGSALDADAAMFSVTSGKVTFTSATINGGTGTVFEVTGGDLRLRGGLEITGCGVAAEVEDGGTVTLNYVTINASQHSVEVAKGGTLILCDFGSEGAPQVKLNQDVYLATGAFITVWDSIYSNVTVECEAPAYGTEIAVGSGYDLTAEDAAFVKCTDGHYKAVLSGNTIILNFALEVFLDGTADANGDGTQASPYNNLTDAINDALANDGTIVVTNTVTISEPATISEDVTLTRDSNYTADGSPMFIIDVPNDGSVSLGQMTISGNGGGIFRVLNGWLVLDNGVTLEHASAAVGLHNEDGAQGKLEMKDAAITNSDYSVWMGGSANTFILSSAKASIDGTVYLGSGAKITLNASLASWTNNLVVTSADTASGTVIATCNNRNTAAQSAVKITANGNAVQANGLNIIIP